MRLFQSNVNWRYLREEQLNANGTLTATCVMQRTLRAMDYARVFRRYREDPTEYSRYHYAIAKELAGFPKREVRERIYESARGEADRPTYEAVWREAQDERAKGKEGTGKRQRPLREGETLSLGARSRARLRGSDVIALGLSIEDLDEKGRRLVEGLLKHLTGENYRLPHAEDGSGELAA